VKIIWGSQGDKCRGSLNGKLLKKVEIQEKHIEDITEFDQFLQRTKELEKQRNLRKRRNI
jgi:hypothetical protein